MHNMSVRFIIIGIIILVFLVLDWYVYQGVKTLAMPSSDATKKWIGVAYWGVTVLSMLLLLSFFCQLLFFSVCICLPKS